MSKKQAKFFCENCGAEVAQNARFCKKCGRFFSSVRCPVCGKTGSSNAFVNGCPSCGYAGKDKGGIASFSTIEQARNASEKKGHFFLHKKHSSQSAPGSKNRVDGSLPAWIYAVTLCALLGIIAGLMKCVLI
ncbi:MAG: zinc ribbon domain-containing protein [Treponemataceae bacterium]|nr:zinc ribbon domain-containing protein [Treponemataceae bacterium]